VDVGSKLRNPMGAGGRSCCGWSAPPLKLAWAARCQAVGLRASGFFRERFPPRRPCRPSPVTAVCCARLPTIHLSLPEPGLAIGPKPSCVAPAGCPWLMAALVAFCWFLMPALPVAAAAPLAIGEQPLGRLPLKHALLPKQPTL